MRNAAAFVLLLPLLACGGEAPGDDPMARGAERIECAVGRAQSFEPGCTLERSASAEGLTLTIRKPDGGFRRLLVTGDGRGVTAADGAEPAIVSVAGENRIEVAIGGDRYRLPATVRAGAQQGQ